MNQEQVVFTTQYDDPFPFAEAQKYYRKWGVLFVVQPEMGNDTLYWVFSNYFMDEMDAEVFVNDR